MSRPVALACVLICALIWGTTWYAITLQLGAVDPAVLGAIEERFLGSLRSEALHQRLATATGNSRR